MRHYYNLPARERAAIRQDPTSRHDYHSNFLSFYEAYKASERAEFAQRQETLAAEKAAVQERDEQRRAERKPGEPLAGADRIRARGGRF